MLAENKTTVSEKENKTTTTKKEKSHFSRNGFFYFWLITLAAFSGYLYLSRDSAVASQKNIFEEEKITLTNKAQLALKKTQKEGLINTMKTLSWAIVNKITLEEWDSIDAFFRQLVKSENILEISYLEDDGRVVVSTNKKKEEDYFPASNLEVILETEKVTFLESDDKVPMVIGPVVNEKNQMGVLVILYRTKQIK